MREDCIECTFEDLLDYEQPTKYIVRSTKYSDTHKTPVLTAGKSFIKGYTNETDGIFDELPTIIFDDFTTATQFVDFPFKVKSSAMKILVPTSKLVNMKFVYNCIQVNQVRNDTHKRYWISVYAKKKILLPSLVEQNAILSKTEELFSDLDNGIANFKKAKDQLKIYRQAVLKKAFEGGFTNENVEEGELPKGWEEKRVSEIANTFGGFAFKSSDFLETGNYQVLRMGNVRPGVIRFNESPVFLNELSEQMLNKALLKIDDVIITQTGTKGKRDYGFSVLINKPNLLLNQRIAAIRCKDKNNPKYLLYFTWTDAFKNQFFANETGNVGQGNVGMKAVTDTLILVPPTTPEQAQIVQEIEFRLSVCDKMEQSINESIEKSQALRQSILKKAFEGKLLSHAEIELCKKEADYEPASELLKKIQAEKLAKEQVKKKPSIKKKGKK
ncbi:MAG: restriction endonuclease subunit S [Bacteroidota bacterium]